MSLAHEIITDESTPLDYEDISKMLSGRVKGMRLGFVDLETVKTYTMETFLPHHRNCCAVLLTAGFGNKVQRHWSVLIRNNKGLFFWESLGLGPAMLNKVVGNTKFLNLLQRHRAHINSHQLQRESKKIRTCGLHITVRISKFGMTNRQYNNWLTTLKLPADETVALLTYLGHHT